MITIIRFEWIRKKKRILLYWLVPLAVMIGTFLLSLLVEHISPEFNVTYMKWPEMLREFFNLSGWSSHLWINIWRVLLLIYSFYLTITMMRETAASVQEEKRLETTVYLRNAGIPKMALPAAKLLFWGSVSLVSCALVILTESLFATVLRYPQGVKEALLYGTRLAGILVVYLFISLFMAVCRTGSCRDKIVGLIFYPWLTTKLSALSIFFSKLLVITGREGKLIDQLNQLGEKMMVLEMLSPITWTFPAVQIRGIYVVFAVFIAIVMLLASFAIYDKKDFI